MHIQYNIQCALYMVGDTGYTLCLTAVPRPSSSVFLCMLTTLHNKARYCAVIFCVLFGTSMERSQKLSLLFWRLMQFESYSVTGTCATARVNNRLHRRLHVCHIKYKYKNKNTCTSNRLHRRLHVCHIKGLPWGFTLSTWGPQPQKGRLHFMSASARGFAWELTLSWD